MPEARLNPYVGPQPFASGEPLFGRDREILDLSYLLTSGRIVLLYSPSGAGKTSLVNAGLIPKLEKKFDIWGPVRVNSEPPPGVDNRYVWSAALGLGTEPPPRDITWAGFLDRRTIGKKYPLIIIDQFEEILRVNPADAPVKRQFFEQLGELLLDKRIWALFILREDYLAPLDPYARLIPTHLQNRYRLDRLTRDAATQAIEKPARGRTQSFGPGVVQTLVNNLAKVKVVQIDGALREEDGEYVEPVQLQVVCFDLWERMLAAGRTTIAAENVGDVQDALANYYDSCIASAAGGDRAAERRIRDWFNEKLITPDGVRNEVRQEPDGSSGGLDRASIQKLVDTYLVRQEPRGSNVWYELAHDRLVEPVRASNQAWLETNTERFQKYAAQWTRENRPESLLFLGEDLLQAQSWARTNPSLVTDLDKDFLHQSAARQELLEREARQARRLRWLVWAAVAAALVAIGFGIYAWRELIHANRQEAIANIERSNAQKALARSREEEQIANQERQNAQGALVRSKLQEMLANEQKEVADQERQKAQLALANVKEMQVREAAAVTRALSAEQREADVKQQLAENAGAKINQAARPKLLPGPIPRGYALLIAINSYKNLPANEELMSPEHDALNLFTFLTSPKGGSLQPGDVHRLIGSLATLSNIKREIEQWLPSVVTPEDRVVIYISVHGFIFDGRAYLFPSDGVPADIKSSYPMDRLVKVVSSNIKAKWSAIFSDVSHSGAINDAAAATGLKDPARSTFWLSASGYAENSFETKALNGEYHSIFAYYMAKGLQGEADINGDGLVTADELAEYVRREVRAYTKGAQNPTWHPGGFNPDMVLSFSPVRLPNSDPRPQNTPAKR